ncbi:carboxylate--amine ligase [Actimicrobium sp. GrIS 1.19]|uniref:carboxylate--amine ligase n=1 Tax=Actimicrobium sp. GrIS 1.19 TaxID=3071708 RepID=UPI002E0DBCBC
MNQTTPLQQRDRPDAIVLSRASTGLETTRCLGKAGVNVHAIYFDRHDPVRFSRYCHAIYYDADQGDDQALLAFVVALSRQIGHRTIVVPSCDAHALLLAEFRDALAPYCQVMTAQYADLQRLVSKQNLHVAVERAGLNTIAAIVAPSAHEATAWSSIHAAPYLIKPFYTGVPGTRLKEKNKVLATRDALLAFIGTGAMDSLIVQRVIPGGDGYIFDCYGYCDRNGRIVAMTTKRRLHQHTPDFGTCTMGEIPALLDEDTEATLYASTRRLFARTPYNGIFGVEWLLDRSTGRFYLIDLNARPFMSIGQVAAAGLNLPALAYADMVGDDITGLEQTPIMRHLIGVDVLRDMQSFQEKQRMGTMTVREWLTALSKCRYFYYTDWRDPGPAIARIATIMRRVVLRVLRPAVGDEPELAPDRRL